ncbi:MAG: hypothetical protein K9J13_01050 [Saprospiraceae bacterium]|nr:hypothetical protein [Saprospiraceae bacterium]
MRNLKILFLFIFIVSLTPAKAISLKDAIKQNLISVNIKGKRGESSHYGKCISLEIKNLTNKSQKIELSPGLFLMPEDSSVQRMMVAEEQLIVLNPSASKKMTINAFCTQMSKSSPSDDLAFNTGKMATGHLLELTQLISKHKFSSSAAQNAIWCITDKNDIYGICSNDENENKILREYVSKATGQPLNKVFYKTTASSGENHDDYWQTHSSKEKITYRDTVVYSNRDGGTYSLIMFAEDSTEMIVFFKDRYIRPNNKTTQSFSLTYSSFPIGKYYFRITKDNNEIIYNKEIIIKAAE